MIWLSTDLIFSSRTFETSPVPDVHTFDFSASDIGVHQPLKDSLVSLPGPYEQEAQREQEGSIRHVVQTE